MIQNNSKPSQSKKRILLYLLLPITFLFASSGITSLFLTSCNKTGTETTFKNFKTKDGKTDVAYGDTAILTAEIKNGVGVVNLVSDDDSVSDEIEIKNVEAEIIDGKVEFEITNNAMSDNIKCNFHLENNGVESKKLTISFKKFVPDPADIIEIDSAIENNYLIPADADITISKTNEKIKFGHPLLDLKALSSDNGNKTYFRLTGDVTFGFLVDPEMTCYLDAENNAKSTITVQDKNACSVVVGTTGSNSFNDFDNKLIIDKSLTLKITSNILTLNGDAVSA
ncbi:hypothetical protein FACS189459_3750 [Bacilli bacterium]|nr:hypothetical protein FACS189459_3750 [Bacilli bacterium]